MKTLRSFTLSLKVTAFTLAASAVALTLSSTALANSDLVNSGFTNSDLMSPGPGGLQDQRAVDNTLDSNAYSARLNPTITVTAAVVTLGDLFEGDIMRPEKAVAKAPDPGQRFVLGSRWLTQVARTYGIDWRPSNTYDRATVYRPGQTIGQSEILDNVRAALNIHGMPNNYGLDVTTPLGNVTVAAEAIPEIGVREAFFDPTTRMFSAVVEIPKGSPNAQFIPLRGKAFPTISVPVLDQNVSKNTIVTEAMVQWVDFPADALRRDTVMDDRLIVGKSPRAYIRAGQPVRDGELVRVTLVDVPVPRHDLREDTTISESHIEWVTMNQSDLTRNMITDADRLIGLTPRRFLAAGAPVRVSDVHAVTLIDVPVAIRDIRRGNLISENDFHWVSMNEHELVRDVLLDADDIAGQTSRRTIRTGQTFHSRDLRLPVVVDRGKIVTIRLSTPFMQLSAKGKALEDGGKNETIRVINTLSNKTILATIIDENTVTVENLQVAMN